MVWCLIKHRDSLLYLFCFFITDSKNIYYSRETVIGCLLDAEDHAFSDFCSNTIERECVQQRRARGHRRLFIRFIKIFQNGNSEIKNYWKRDKSHSNKIAVIFVGYMEISIYGLQKPKCIIGRYDRKYKFFSNV
jgi:hypothetical protein